jgi:hypothetical protein
MCSSYTGWTAPPDSEAAVPVFFQALARQCRPATAGWAPTSTTEGPRRPICLIINDNDTVVDVAAARRWARMLPGSVTTRYRYPGHIPLVRAATLITGDCPVLSAG